MDEVVEDMGASEGNRDSRRVLRTGEVLILAPPKHVDVPDQQQPCSPLAQVLGRDTENAR